MTEINKARGNIEKYGVINLVRSSSNSLQILSKDSVTVAVDAVVYFRISNATISGSFAFRGSFQLIKKMKLDCKNIEFQ